MKKILTLMLAAGMTFSAVNAASAVDVKIDGTFDFAFSGTEGINGSNSFMDEHDYRRNTGREQNQRHFDVLQRLRLGAEFTMSEQLSGYYQMQVGTFTWGGPYKGAGKAENDGSALGTRAANIVTRLAYLDWMVPRTSVHVRMGQQPVALPGFAAGSPVLDDTAAGVVISSPIGDHFDIAGMWLRAVSDPLRNSSGEYELDSADVDLFGLVGNVKFDDFTIVPWAMVGHGGKNFERVRNAGTTASGVLPFNGMERIIREGDTYWGEYSPSSSTIWFGGVSGELRLFDPFRFALDFYCSGLNNAHSSTERGGWYIAGLAEYKTPWVTPALAAWYASGDDSNPANGSEQPLSLSGNFQPGASTYFKGRYSIANTINNSSPAGTWGLSAQLNSFTFLEGLSHDLRLTYFQGTNSKNMPGFINGVYGDTVTPASYLTEKDKVIEIDFDTTYEIYKNFFTVLELSYAFQDFDKSVWRNTSDEKGEFSDAWRAALNFRYKF